MFRSLFLILIFVLSSCSTLNQETHLRPFKTDGCSLYPDGSWLHCCIAHDLAYWAGGDHAEKDLADQELGLCVEKATTKRNAEVMMNGVKFGGGPNNLFPWAWGYGWTKNLGYKKLSPYQSLEVLNRADTIVPEVREYEARLTNAQLSYILKSYQNLLQKKEGLR